MRKGDYLPATPDAEDIAYDNTASGLAADDVQDAIDENDGRLDDLEAVASGLVLLNSGTVTNQATLDIPLTSFTAYRALKFVLSSFVPATDDVELWMRTSTDGGANYDSGASNYAYAARSLFNNATTGDIASAGATQIVLAGFSTNTFAVSNVANEGGVDVEATLHNQTRAAFGRVLYHAGFVAAVLTNSNAIVVNGCGSRLAAADVDAVQFRFESGNIASGSWALYGYA